MIIKNIIDFLYSRSWRLDNESIDFLEFLPPPEFQLPDYYRLHILKDTGKIDSERSINNLLEIISDLYDLTLDDIIVLIKNESSILKVRVYDDQTEKGKMPLTRFEEFIEKIRAILSDTASFVIDRNVMSSRIPEEVSKYLSLCNFMQTEKGSFVANIQLPSRELIKNKELFEREAVYSEDINKKLCEILTYINHDILEGDVQVSEDYLIDNESRINVKLFKDISAFYEKVSIKNIDFSFHNIWNSHTITNQNISKQKLYKLNSFVEQIELQSFEVGNFTFKGRIITLKSKDPDGLSNSVTFVGLNDDIQMVAVANLDSNHYKDAIEAHKLKQNITISGLAKRTKSKARFIEITGFVIED